MCQLLPSFLARPILRLAERKGWLGRVYFGMEVTSTSISGYLRFLILAKLRALRPYGYRYKQEQGQIDAWLGLIRDAVRLSPELALEITECARLIKGYGDTHVRGGRQLSCHRASRDPARAGSSDAPARAVDAIASARAAALVDPEGESLARCLADIEEPALRMAAE
jgi:indolepyruvate ferredoxin oxidoreductase beta subunit